MNNSSDEIDTVLLEILNLYTKEESQKIHLKNQLNALTLDRFTKSVVDKLSPHDTRVKEMLVYIQQTIILDENAIKNLSEKLSSAISKQTLLSLLLECKVSAFLDVISILLEDATESEKTKIKEIFKNNKRFSTILFPNS